MGSRQSKSRNANEPFFLFAETTTCETVNGKKSCVTKRVSAKKRKNNANRNTNRNNNNNVSWLWSDNSYPNTNKKKKTKNNNAKNKR